MASEAPGKGSKPSRQPADSSETISTLANPGTGGAAGAPPPVTGPGKGSGRKVLKGAIALVMLAALVASAVWATVSRWDDIMSVVSSQEALQKWLAGFGNWAAMVYLVLQILQIVIFVIPGEVIQLAGGFIFGPALGLVLAVAGAMIGTLIAYALSRLLGRSAISGFVPADKLEYFDGVLSSPRAQIVLFLLFLIPGLPKDILCYVGGLSPLGPWRFLLISTLGRLPALMASIFFGSAIAQGNWTVAWIIGGIATVLFLLGMWKRKEIHDWLSGHLGKDHKKSPD